MVSLNAVDQKFIDTIKGNARLYEFKHLNGDNFPVGCPLVTSIITYLKSRMILNIKIFRIIDDVWLPLMFHYKNNIYAIIHDDTNMSLTGRTRPYYKGEKKAMEDICSKHNFKLLIVKDLTNAKQLLEELIPVSL